MGNCCLSNKSKIKIIDETPKGKQYDYLRPEGMVCLKVVLDVG